MPGPKQTLCPRCNARPRRAPGLSCVPCFREYQRERRMALREGRARRLAPDADPQFSRPLSARRYLITSAQNATPVHPEFFASLRAAATELGAELVVIPLRYKNPTSLWSQKQEHDEWWAAELHPYLFNQRRKLNRNLVLVGDVKVQPTASSPLSGFEALTGAESAIIGHQKMQFRSVPAPTGRRRYPKILSTTGSITQVNATDTRAGALADFHHYLGAVLVELDGNKRFHLRQLNADRATGEFIDLDRRYTPTGSRPAPRALGLVLGDTHARFTCPRVDRATFGPGGIVDTLDPKTVVFHDLFDGYAVNPHHVGNPFIAAVKVRAQLGAVREEVEHAVRFVAKRTRGREAVVIASNHNDFLSRWILATDWRQNPANAAFYLETAAAMLASSKLTEHGASYVDPFRYWVDKLKGDASIRCLDPDESFRLGEVECSLHGDRGPNGARGSLRNLSRIGTRVISGHSHTPGINEGHYQCGTSTPLRLEYTHGPSSWLNTHCVVYGNGARALITVIDGAWRGPAKTSPRRTQVKP